MKTIITSVIGLFIALQLQAQAPAPANIPDKPEMIQVEGGFFNMGSNENGNEKPIHQVQLSSFKISKYPITVGQYKAFVAATGISMPDKTPKWGWQENHPMVNVSWQDAVAYCNWLDEKYGGDWCLPTEAQWEYAAKGGQKSRGYTYAGSNDLLDVAWFEDNAGEQTQAVGRKKANELGIHDMSGNVWEWCRDWYDYDYYAKSPGSNPRGAASGSYRVMRGGSWSFSAAYCRVAYRSISGPSYRGSGGGFRVVL